MVRYLLLVLLQVVYWYVIIVNYSYFKGAGAGGDKYNPVAIVDTNNVLSGKTVSAISAGYIHSMVLAYASSVYSIVTWGGNTYGQLVSFWIILKYL
jgi:hypothetical protein